jgi:hypothetical protein
LADLHRNAQIIDTPIWRHSMGRRGPKPLTPAQRALRGSRPRRKPSLAELKAEQPATSLEQARSEVTLALMTGKRIPPGAMRIVEAFERKLRAEVAAMKRAAERR